MIKNKLGIYARQSREKETTGSIDDQISQGIIKATELGLEYQVYIDRGESAAHDTLNNRHEFMRLMQDIKNGIITAVFVYDESRLTRNQTTKLIIKSVFSEHNIKVHTKIEGVIDFNDSDNEFMSDIRTLFASKFVKDTSKKIKGVLRNRAAEGKAHTGILKPFGYTSDKDKNLILHDEEAQVIKEIYSLCLLGYGTGRIAEKLNEDGIETKGRKLLKNGIRKENRFTKEIKHIPNSELVWVGNTVLSILKNSIYKGERKYQDEIFKAPAIVSEEVWNKAQLQIGKNKKQTGKIKYKYLLRGLCSCGRCGSNFVGRTRESKKDHYYYCSSKIQKHKRCGIRSINIDYLDELIWSIITNSKAIVPYALKKVDELKSPDSIKTLCLHKEQINDKLRQYEKDKVKIISLFKKDLLSEEEVDKDLKKIKESVLKHREDLSLVESQLVEHDTFKGIFNEMDEFQNQLQSVANTIDYNLKSTLVRSFVDNILINYCENDEVYTIDVRLKVFDFIDQHTFYISRQKHDILEKGSKSGMFTSGLPEYLTDNNQHEIIDDSYLRACYASIKDYISKKNQTSLSNDASPPNSTRPPIWRSLGAEQTHNPVRSRWPTMAYYF